MAKRQKTTLQNWPANNIEVWSLADIKPYPNNPRTHPPAQITALANTMKDVGVTMPILVDDAGVIIAGHGRRLAAIEAGFEEYPVAIAVGWSEERKRAERLKDNTLGLMSGWDVELIKGEVGWLKNAGYNIPLLAFPEVQLRSFGLTLGTEGNVPEYVPPPPKNPVTKAGDIWECGKHRIICGDATNQKDVDAVLAGNRPKLMVTDPPYGVNYDPGWREEMGIDWMGQVQRSSTHPEVKKLSSRALGKVRNDHRADWSEAWKLFTGNVAYVWCASMLNDVVIASLEKTGFERRAQIIWVKQHFVFGRGDFHWQHEPCWYVVRKGKKSEWAGDRKQTTVWTIANASAFHGAKDDEVTGHGTQKPIECMKRPIENNSRVDDCVYDPFLGSGTTLIAAEMTRRTLFGLELDPGYCDVAVERWQKFASKEARIAGSDHTFKQVAADRKRKKKEGVAA